MTRIEFNKETRLFEIVQNKNNKVLATSTGLEGAQRIMDKWDDILEAKEKLQASIQSDSTRFKGTVQEFFDSSKKMLEDAECPDCGGDGYTTCCGVGCTEPGWPDSDICAGCYEHTGDSCDTCNGKGEIKL